MLSFGRGFAMAANSFANAKYVNPFVLCANCLRKTQNFEIELVIIANLLTNFKYGNLFEEMANSSENDNITIGFRMSLG